MKTIYLDINLGASNAINLTQFDYKSEKVTINLLKDRFEYDLTGKTVRLQGIKADKKALLLPTVIKDKNVIEFEITEQLTVVSGIVKLQLLVFGENGSLKNSKIFAICIDESLNIGEIIASDNDFKEIKDTLIKVEEWDKYFQETNGKLEEKYTTRLNEISSDLDNMVNLKEPIIKNFINENEINLMLFGIDSLTNGASGSKFGDFLYPRLEAEFGNGGIGYVPFENGTILSHGGSWGTVGMTPFNNLGNGEYPLKYSFDCKGVFTNNGDGVNTKLGFTMNFDWENIKILYLKQPNGGTFDCGFVQIYSTTKQTVDTNSNDYDLGVFDFPIKNTSITKGNFDFRNISGKVCIFGVYLTKSKGVICNNLGNGGNTLEWHNSTEPLFRDKWIKALNPKLYMFNGGANDRLTQSDTQFYSMLESYLRPFINNGCNITLVRPNSVTTFNDVIDRYDIKLKQFAVENKLDYISDRDLLGDVESATKNGYMSDGVHPSITGNIKRANKYLAYFGVSKIGRKYIKSSFANEVQDYIPITKLSTKRVVNVSNKTLVYKLGLVAGYPTATLKLEVTADVNGTVCILKKEIYLAFKNNTNTNQVVSKGNSIEKEDYKYDYINTPTINYIVDFEINNNMLDVFVTPNTGGKSMNFVVTGEVIMTNIPSKGQVVFEN